MQPAGYVSAEDTFSERARPDQERHVHSGEGMGCLAVSVFLREGQGPRLEDTCAACGHEVMLDIPEELTEELLAASKNSNAETSIPGD
jgi:hypothetical protein